jgi:hypothetical protein
MLPQPIDELEKRIWTSQRFNEPAVANLKRLLIPALLTGVLLISAAAISLDLSGYLDSNITCPDIMRAPKAGCRTNLGQSLSLLWGMVAGLIGLIWLRHQDS